MSGIMSLYEVNPGVFGSRIVSAACLQNETAPEELLNRYEKWFEKREKGSEKRSEMRPKSF